MAKIIIKEINKVTNYFEVNYIFFLDIPQSQIDANNKFNTLMGLPEDLTTTIQKPGTSSYKVGTTIATIKADLESKYNSENNKTASDSSKDFLGISWDGSTWK